jgi:hypothetical protein
MISTSPVTMLATLLFDPFLAGIGFFGDSLCLGFKLQWHNSHNG